MNILFISEPYIERLLLDYFTYEKTHTFIMLKLNHPEIKNNIENNICFLHLQEALISCDCIYILYSENISNSIISKCKLVSKERGLPLYCVNNQKKQDTKEYLGNILKSYVPNLPLILLLQAGVNTQIEKAEIALCHTLIHNNIKYKLHTNTWLPQINTMSTNLNTIPAYITTDIDAQISIFTIGENLLDLSSNHSENIFFDSFMRTIHPDYIIVCCENDYSLQNKLSDFFQCKYSYTIDVFYRSEYVSLKSNDDEFSLFVENVTNTDLFDDIKTKLTYPLGVKEIFLK